MCGTAAVVVKVNSITHGETTLTFDDFDAGMHCDLCGWHTFVAAQSLLLHEWETVWKHAVDRLLFPPPGYAKDVISSLRSELTAIQCRSPSCFSVRKTELLKILQQGHCKSDTDHWSGDIVFVGRADSNPAISLHWGGEVEDKHGWMKEVCDVVNDSIPEARRFLPLLFFLYSHCREKMWWLPSSHSTCICRFFLHCCSAAFVDFVVLAQYFSQCNPY